jgi:hypothetical protein
MTPIETERRYLKIPTRDSRKGAPESQATLNLKAKREKKIRQKNKKKLEMDAIEIAACEERMRTVKEEDDLEEENDWARYREQKLEYEITQNEQRRRQEEAKEEALRKEEERKEESERQEAEYYSIETLSSTRPISKIPRWQGQKQKTPRLQESASRSEPGTPGALGGGPVQPPGGPGGTRDQGYKYAFEDPGGERDRRRRHYME